MTGMERFGDVSVGAVFYCYYAIFNGQFAETLTIGI